MQLLSGDGVPLVLLPVGGAVVPGAATSPSSGNPPPGLVRPVKSQPRSLRHGSHTAAAPEPISGPAVHLQRVTCQPAGRPLLQQQEPPPGCPTGLSQQLLLAAAEGQRIEKTVTIRPPPPHRPLPARPLPPARGPRVHRPPAADASTPSRGCINPQRPGGGPAAGHDTVKPLRFYHDKTATVGEEPRPADEPV